MLRVMSKQENDVRTYIEFVIGVPMVVQLSMLRLECYSRSYSRTDRIFRSHWNDEKREFGIVYDFSRILV